MAVPTVPNKSARALFMHLQGLSAPPGKAMSKRELLALIRSIGFVQVDSIRTVERAHHMILFARNQTYRPEHLKQLLERDGELFENWTHDASIIPSAFYPHWRHRFALEESRLAERWRRWNRTGFEDQLDAVLGHVERNGSCMSRDMGGGTSKSGGLWWNWHPKKAALEYLWRTGALAVARREGFQKVYDLPERVIAAHHFAEAAPDRAAFVDWACASALDRLGFATHGEIAAFWELVSPAEAREWCERQGPDDLIRVRVESADGSKPKPSHARPDYEETLASLPKAPARLRVLSPFDPLIRDRKRTLRLFGFDYRIEIFVPEAKRRYGYYVFPLLEGDRLIGRMDMKHDRKDGNLVVGKLWLEPKTGLSSGRRRKIEAELERIRKFTGAEKTVHRFPPTS